MMDTRATIVSVSERYVILDIPDQRQFACGVCAMSATCGQASSGRVKRYRFFKPQGMVLLPGDVVVLRTRHAAFRTGLVYAYGLPTVLALVGIVMVAGVMQENPYRDLMMGMGALIGVLTGFLLAAWRNRAYQPEIIPLSVASMEATIGFSSED